MHWSSVAFVEIDAVPEVPACVSVNVEVGFGTTEPIMFWKDHESATELSVPAVPVFTVPFNCRTGLLETAEEIITGTPPLAVVPVAFVTVMVVVVEAVMTKVPLLPVAVVVYPEIVTLAFTHPFEPAPVSDAFKV